jgi:hypothetical protein
MLRDTWIYVVAFVLAALRIAGHKSQAFQAVAHLFVGALLGQSYYEGWRRSPSFWLAVVLSIIELACGLWFMFGAT